MVDPLTDNYGNVNFESFRKFLDSNPAIRTLIKIAVKPQLWTLNEKGYAQFHPEDIKYDIGGCEGLNANTGIGSSSALKSSVLDSKVKASESSMVPHNGHMIP